jgi:hypothetical protein
MQAQSFTAAFVRFAASLLVTIAVMVALAGV